MVAGRTFDNRTEPSLRHRSSMANVLAYCSTVIVSVVSNVCCHERPNPVPPWRLRQYLTFFCLKVFTSSLGRFRKSARLSSNGVCPPSEGSVMQQKNMRRGHAGKYESSLCRGIKNSGGYSVELYIPELIRARGVFPPT